MLREYAVRNGVGVDPHFRWRGTEVSRVEGFSDAAFAFAVTLLVISLEAPTSYDALLDMMRGLPAFAACFAILLYLWHTHYRFFRRFGLQDGLTIRLNGILLFIIMFYVYPLKFVFVLFIGGMTGLTPGQVGGGESASENAVIHFSQVNDLFVIYGLGFAATWLLFAAMNWRAYALRRHLELDSVEINDTRAEITRTLWLACLGVASTVLALTLRGAWVQLAGWMYGLIGVVEFVVGYRFGRRRDALLKEREIGVAVASEA